MAFQLIHKILLVGIASVILSFVFFALNTNTYTIILLVGIIISGVSFLIAMLMNDSRKSKLRWALVVLASIFIQWFSEPFFIRLSYIILIKQNQKILSSVNDIFLSKKGNAIWVTDSVLWKRNNVTVEEGQKIRHLLSSSRFFHVAKDSSRVYYMTFSRLDVTHGLVYYYSDYKPTTGTHLIGNWYY